MRLLIFCASLLLALGLFYGRADGVQLIGCGTPTATDALAQWAKSYRYTRDDITFAYRPMESTPGVITYATGQADFLGLNTGIPKVLLDYYALSQFPIVGQALVMAYNISTLPSSRSLVLDRNTLGLIWAGNITTWNDPRITSIPDNAGLTFPAELIKLAYDNGDNTSLTEVVRLGLESFSPDFKKVLNSLQVNRSMELLPPAVDGRATLTTMYDADRVAFLQRTPNSMAYMSWSSAVAANLSYIDLYNRAGTLVEASRSSVQAAMASVTGRVSAGDISVNIVDANGTNSWPLAYLFYVTLNQNTVVHQCSLVNDLIEFVAWILSNDAASDEADAYYFVPIDVSLRKTVIDAISQVKCKGERALQANYLIGSGSSLSLFTSWSVLRTSSTNKMKYFQSSSTSAKQQLVKSDLHYGVVADGLSQGWRNNMTDAELMPAVVFALVPAYNLPNLPEQLVLDYKTIALIFMNEITMWNDTRIKSLNSVNVSAALPNASITVVTTSVPSSYTLLFTTALARMAPDIFTITPGDLVNFPVDADRTIGVTSNAEALTAFSNSYTFGFWTAYEATLSRVLGSAAIRKEGNYTVSVSGDSLRSALRDYLPQVSSTTNPSTTPMTTTSSLRARGEPDLTYGDLILMPSKESWPFAAFASFIYRSQNMTDCSRAQTLADFFYWSQTSEAAASTASGSQGLVLATSEDYLWRRFLGQLKSFTCQGQPVSNVYNCINEGQLCSGAGQCTNNACVCNTNREGQYCQNIKASDDNLGVILGVTIPVSLVLACVLLSVILLLLFLARRGGKKTDDWEINYSELDVGEPLGSGGFGAVHKATWKGTEVAVKVIASEKITRDIERAFKDEVRVMTSLRHPNVVLFMAASTKAPNFCIVMEFMALGSLYDLLHNELIPEIPFALKAKMAYQASKGMHFLHSSGIVHRDLKSLNLLLDNKWNAKVSDFGLTRFKEEVKGTGKDIVGSVHWAAPEILNESPGVDLILADVYSFGIILWELLTREQPYFGLSPAAVAVAVIRDGIRPRMPEEPGACPAEYEELIRAAWHQDPTVRPTFLEIMTRLSAMHGESSASNTGLSFTSKTSTSSSGHSTGKDLAKNAYSSWTLPSTNGSISTGSSSSSGGSKHMSGVQTSPDGSRPPEGELAIVFTDITRAASLWEFNAAAMRDATLLHNQALREALVRHRGYEVVFLKDRNSGEGSFCMAFQQAADAVAWCCEVQRALLDVEWPEALLSHPGAAEEWGDTDDRVLFKGLRVRMGIHVGTPRLVRDPMTRRVEYIGPVVNAAARITAMTHGGQILVSHTAHRALLKAISEVGTTPAGGTTPALTIDKSNIVKLGTFEMPDAPTGSKLYEIKVPELAGRFFGGVTKDGNSDNGTPSSGSEEREAEAEAAGSMSSDEHFNPRRGGQRQAVQTMVGEGMMFKEDTFLTSANLCRWIIDFGEIQVGKQVGLGSYGVVYRGKWKGVDVAVKRFIKQKLDERRMLEFRAEMAFLSELHHPNIVLFVGACVKRPNLCIVTEFMKQGSLKDILSDNAIKLTWQQKLRLLRGAALGINYLHSLQPVIVHRDLKPSNLLVDETWNVKVADFGFARIKEENATMTRCGTPCWTAPEIIRGEKYDEAVDVFSFGVVMWQVLTRKEPFAGRNFMGVSLDVLEGRRPAIPNDCPPQFRKTMKKCWHANRSKRPTMESVVTFLDSLVDDDTGLSRPSA